MWQQAGKGKLTNAKDVSAWRRQIIVVVAVAEVRMMVRMGNKRVEEVVLMSSAQEVWLRCAGLGSAYDGGRRWQE